MAYNKSFVQYTLMKLLDFYILKWRDLDAKNYTRFINIVKSLLQEKDTKELDARIKHIEDKYHLKFDKLENLIFQMKISPLKSATLIIKIPNGNGEGWDKKEKININHFQAEKDLNDLIRWCLIKLHLLACRSNIDFTNIPELRTPEFSG